MSMTGVFKSRESSPILSETESSSWVRSPTPMKNSDEKPSISVEMDRVPQELILGIRPEHIEIGLEKDDDYFAATCSFVEPMGNRQILHLSIGGQPIKAKVVGTARALRGKRVWVRFSPEEIRVFDADSYELII